MTDATRPGQSDFIRIAQQLLAAIETAQGEDREAAKHELQHFLRMNGAGRLQEWITSREGK